MDIILDSTEYKRDKGFNKANLSWLSGMASLGLVKIHIPYFVYQECITSSITDLKKELNQLLNSVRSLHRKGLYFDECRRAIELEKPIEEINKRVEESTRELWEDFITRSKAKLYDFDEKDSVAVFNAYFSGEPPFKGLKKRDDIPDAFIYESVKKISDDKLVYLISADKNLIEHCSRLKNIKTFSYLNDLFDNLDFRKVEKNYLALIENNKIKKARELLLLKEDCFEEAMHRFLYNLTQLQLENTNLPSPNGMAEIISIEKPTLKIIKEGIKFAQDTFFVPIKIEGIASVNYLYYKHDYYNSSYKPPITRFPDEKYYFVEDTLPIQLKKTIDIPIGNIKEDMPLNLYINDYEKVIFNLI